MRDKIVVDSLVKAGGPYSGIMGYPGSVRFYWGEPVPNQYKEYNKNERTKGTSSDTAKP